MFAVEFLALSSFAMAGYEFKDTADLKFYLIIIFMYLSIIGKFLTNCYSIFMLYIVQLIDKLNESINRTMDDMKSEDLKKLSSFEIMELCCKLSDKLDTYTIIYRNFADVTRNLVNFMSFHLMVNLIYICLYIVLQTFLCLSLLIFSFANLNTKTLIGCLLVFVFVATQVYHVYTLNFVTQMVQDGVRLIAILSEH